MNFKLDVHPAFLTALLLGFACSDDNGGASTSTNTSETGSGDGDGDGDGDGSPGDGDGTPGDGDGDGTPGDGDGDGTPGDGDGDGMPGDGDGDGDGDGTPGDGDGDGAPLTCADIEAAYDMLVGMTGCSDDSDCKIVFGQCGVGLGGCYHAVNSSVDEADLVALGQQYAAGNCTDSVCDCPEPPAGAQCFDGACIPLP
jgi:hypothetical protein